MVTNGCQNNISILRENKNAKKIWVFLYLGLFLALFSHPTTAQNHGQGQGRGNPNRHCVVNMLPLAEGEIDSEITAVNCFSNAFDALNFATNGRIASRASRNSSFSELLVALESAASPSSEEIARGITPLTTYVNGIHFNTANYNGIAVSYTSQFQCTASQSFGHSNMASYGWDNMAESSKALSGCNNFWHYDLTSWQGAVIFCGTLCSTLGALGNNVTSWHLRN